MRTILHIVTQPRDELLKTLLAAQQALPDTKVEVVELPTPGEAGYGPLVEQIFAADSVSVW